MTEQPMRILAVCTHNRTRSVLVGALLGQHLAEAHVPAEVTTSGFARVNLPPTRLAVDELARRGIDVRAHRSGTVAPGALTDVDLVVAAERAHVIRLCADDPDAFTRTFTLPELLALGEMAGPRRGRPLGVWLEILGAGRSRRAYADGVVPEVADPTGSRSSAFAAAVAAIDDQCRRLAALLV